MKNKVIIITMSVICIVTICIMVLVFNKKSNQSNVRDESKSQIEIVNEYINIREERNVNSKVLGKVYKGEIYTVINEYNDTSFVWILIKTSNGIKGYISGKEQYVKRLYKTNHDIVSSSSTVNDDISSSSNIKDNPSSSKQNNKPTNDDKKSSSVDIPSSRIDNTSSKTDIISNKIDIPSKEIISIDATFLGCKDRNNMIMASYGDENQYYYCAEGSYKQKILNTSNDCDKYPTTHLEINEETSTVMCVTDAKPIQFIKAVELNYGYEYYNGKLYRGCYGDGRFNGLALRFICPTGKASDESCVCRPEDKEITGKFETCKEGYYELGKNYFIYNSDGSNSKPKIKKHTCYKRDVIKYTCPNGYTLKDDKCYKNN